MVSSVVGYRHINRGGEASCNVLVAWGTRLLLYSGSGPRTLKLVWSREAESPILRVELADVTGDGVPEMVVLTLTACHVLQQTRLFDELVKTIRDDLRVLVRIQQLEHQLQLLKQQQ